MRKLLLVFACALTILSAIGCNNATNRYYDIRLQSKARDEQRWDTVQRDLRTMQYDFDTIFGLNYMNDYNDYPTPNY